MSNQKHPAGSPVHMPGKLRQLIRDTYPDTEERLSIITMIEGHLDHLNGLGRFERAREFLEEEEIGVRADAEQRAKERRRATLRVVSRVAIPAVVLVLLKIASGFPPTP